MGLDQYLYKKHYIGAQYEHNNVTGVIEIKKDGKSVDINFKKVSYITEEAFYWRKANQIHQWFVENVQDGEDDCKEYDVSIEQLKQLYYLCVEVLDDHTKAEQLLPTSTGFFFGSNEYNEWYFQDIQNTKDFLETIIDEESNFDSYYTYSSSW